MIMLFAFFFALMSSPPALAEETAQKVRVGYFIFSGFQDVDDKGMYSGYGYEYLQEISKYTGWEYSYVFATWDECLDMLAKGEIDLLGSARYTSSRAALYDYPENESGRSYAVLCAAADNTDIAYQDFIRFNQMTVGLLAGSSRNKELFEYSEKNNFSFQANYYDTQRELLSALRDGRVDAILTSNLRKSKNERIIARFSPSPFYFITTKGNQEILDGLNRAQAEIKLTDPYFDMRLYEKYYRSDPSPHLVFTEEEREFIKAHGTVTAVYDPSWAPIEYYDAKTGKFSGITAEIFELIAKRSGMKFNFIPTKSFSESIQIANTEQADIICGFSNDRELAKLNGLVITRPYMSAPIIKITSLHTDATASGKIALTENHWNAGKLISSENPGMTIVYYATTKECFDALERGEVAATYADSHVADLLLRDYHYRGLVTTALSNHLNEQCIGISSSANKTLLSILNKTLHSISSKEINEIIIKKTVRQKELTVMDIIYQKPIELLLFSALFFLSIILALSYFIFTKNRANKRIHNLLYRDTLTGIYNLNKFRLETNKLLAKRGARPYAVVCTDIEKFKYINDIYGYAEADKILQSLAKIIAASVSEGELFARIGADNFVMLLRYTDRSAFIQRLAKAADEAGGIKGTGSAAYNLIFTSGIYVLRPQDLDVTPAMDKANIARKRIKGFHKSNAAFYDEQIEEDLLFEKELEMTMAASLCRGEFVPYYQPKYDLATKSIIGAEALVRWHHPEKGFIPPIKFIPLFEKNGFITELDFYMYATVCKTLRSWLDEGRAVVPISVNVSRVHLQKQDFTARLKEIVRRYRVPIHLLELEITESAVIENITRLTTVLHELKTAGFTLVMDDFGVGYSSLSFLKDLPIDIVKLDKEFLQADTVSDKEKIIIQGFVQIARNLNIDVVSEGVETAQQAQMLADIGCGTVQGYLFAKPMPLAELNRKLYPGEAAAGQ